MPTVNPSYTSSWSPEKFPVYATLTSERTVAVPLLVLRTLWVLQTPDKGDLYPPIPQGSGPVEVGSEGLRRQTDGGAEKVLRSLHRVFIESRRLLRVVFRVKGKDKDGSKGPPRGARCMENGSPG